MANVLNKFRLDGKVAIITGASRGIGEAIARAFASAGAKLVLSSRKQIELDQVAERIRAEGGEAYVVPAHAGKIEDIKSLVQKTVEHYGRIDILVNNAGTNPVFGPIINVDEKVWDKIFEVNLRGFFFLSKEVANIMSEKGGGVIINMASVAGIKPGLGLGAYSISKAGVIMLTRVLAQEWAGMNIRVNAIAPGVIKTKFAEALYSSPELTEEILRGISIKRLGEPEDIVGVALFLASEASAYITGETIVVDGGGIML
ncbi:MAG: SDR family NAD(P)-dependent oxidoreductase [bacterium]